MRKGFGLIEQIIALLVLAMLIATAVPALRGMLAGHELRTAQMEYIAALQHARNLAVMEQVRIIFCPSRDAHTCNGDNHWRDGWLIGRDLDRQQQSSGPPLYVGGKYSDAIHVVGSQKKYFLFKPDGSSANSMQSLVFCTREQPPRVRVLRVAREGRIRAAPPEAADVAQCAAND